MLDGIHGKTGRQHQDEDNKNRGQKLLLLADQNFGDYIQRVIIGVDPEKTKDPRHPDQAERNGADREKHRQIVWQEGKQIDDSGCGKRVLIIRPGADLIRIQAGRRIHPQHIVKGEKSNRDSLHLRQKRTVMCLNRVEGDRKCPRQVNEQHGDADDVIALVNRVVHHADRDHFKHSLPHSCQLLSVTVHLLKLLHKQRFR